MILVALFGACQIVNVFTRSIDWSVYILHDIPLAVTSYCDDRVRCLNVYRHAYFVSDLTAGVAVMGI